MYDPTIDDSCQREERTIVSLPSFEELSALAENDPIEFEALRLRLCGEFIDSAPDYLQKRLEGLQFTIDMERKRSRSSYSLCLKISEMMNESLAELSQVLTNPEEFRRNYKSTTCEVIPLFPIS